MGEQIGATVASHIVGIMTQILANWQQLSGSRQEPLDSRQQLPVPTPREDKLMKAAEVAAVLNISKTKAYQMMPRGEISAVHTGRTTRIRAKDLEEFIVKNLKPAE